AVERRLAADALDRLAEVAGAREARVRAELADQGVAPDRIRVIRRAHLRYEGTDTAVPVTLAGLAEMTAEFEAAYRRTYSFLMPRPLVVEAVSVEAVGLSDVPDLPRGPDPVPGPPPAPAEMVRLWCGGWRDAPLHLRERLRPGDTVTGPAIISEANATTVVEDGWRAEVTRYGHLVLTRVREPVARERVGTEVDPVLLEIFNNLFMSRSE